MAAWKIGPVLAARQLVGAQALGEVPADGAFASRSWRSRRAFPKACSTSCPASDQTAGKALALHMDVDCIAFTGSTATGRSIMQYAGQSNMKRVSAGVRRQVAQHRHGRLPGPGRAPPPRPRTPSSSTRARSARPARACWCRRASRMPCWRRCRRSAARCSPGDPLDAATKLGAIVDDIQMKRVLGYIDAGRTRRREGALRRPQRARGDAAAISSSRPCSMACVPA